MKKNKKLKINLRQAIGIGLSSIFLLLLFLSLKWANYQKIFVLNEPIISGYNILNKKDYKSIIDQLEYETINKAYIVEIRKALERDKFMTPEEAREFGLIDEVVEKRP